MSDFKKVVIVSNYSWAYLSAEAARRCFPGKRLTLVTTNIEDVAKKHDFGMEVIELKNFNPRNLRFIVRQIRQFKKMDFEAAAIDYGFNFNTIILLLFMRFKKIFIMNLNCKEVLRPLTKAGFLKIVCGKIPYFINKILIRLSMDLRLDISLGSPSEVSIETTTVCNLKCKGCPTGLGQLNRPSTPITRELFDSITDRNKANFRYFDIIYPFIFGEPLLNKDIFGYLDKLRSLSYPYTRIEVHTNGNIPNSKEIVRRLLETNVDLVNISVDGTDKVAYESFRRGGSFDLVCEFVRNLTSAKKEMGVLRPEIVVQMIVTKFSEPQVGEFKKLKEDLGADRLTFKGFFHEFTDLSDEEGYSLAPMKKNLTLDREEKKEIIARKRNLCGWAYRAISIMCNGNVTPCCIDFNTALLEGLNIYGSTIKDIWNSTKYRGFRRDMLRGNIETCNKCFFS